MKIAPDFDAFAATYDAGRAQVAWTTLVADLETPVSAMLKLGAGRKSVPARIRRGRRGARPLFDHRAGPGPDLALPRRPGGDQPPRSEDETAFIEANGGALASLRQLIAEARIDLPTTCRRWPPGCSAIWATTWCG